MKKLLLKSMLLLCALVVGSMNGWADTAIATATATNGKSYVVAYFVNNKYYALPHGTTVTVYDGTEVTLNGINKVNETTAADLAWTLTEGTTAGQFYLSYTSGTTTYYLYKNGGTSNSNYNIKGNSTSTQKHYWEFTLNSGNNDYTIKSLKSDQGTSTAIYLGYATAGKFGVYAQVNAAKIILLEIGDDPSATPTCVAPTFSPAAGAVLSGTEVTLSTTTNGATIYYTMGDNPADPTDASTEYDSNNKPTITAATTIKAIAIKAGSNNSTVSSASYTIATPLTNIAALTAEITTGTKYVTLTNAVVTYVNGKYAFIQDASGAVVYYANSHTLVAGNTLTGVATVTYQPNNSNPQITALSGVTPATGSAPSPTSVAQSAWTYTFANVLNQYFEITGATITKTGTNYFVELNGDNVQLYKRGSALGDLNLSRKYTITGFPMLYSTTKELQIFVEPVEEATSDPLIDASNLTIEFDAISGEIPYTIEHPTGASLTAAKTTGDWISNVEVDGANSKVTFSATANNGAQRTGAITLSYTGAEDKVITVTQKKYGIATLPFTWAGGASATFAALYGVTLSGNGTSDYGSSHNPYNIKLDDTDDYILIRTNGQPGIVTIGVKMAGGANTSKFSVLSSSNGTDFTKLEDLTISGAQNDILSLQTTKAFASDVRWVKLSFTKGSNVGVGPISVKLPASEPADPTVDDVNHTITLTTTTNMDGWRTFYPSKADQAYTTDADVYYASATGESTVTLTKIDGGVPANTPVVLHKDGATSIVLTETGTAITAPGASNKLAVSTAGQNLGKVFRLGFKSGAGKGVGFYSYTTTSAPAGIIYVSSITAGARDYLEFSFEDETTGVNEVKAQKVDGEYYNLAGQRVAQPTKGLYIVNGKKVIIK